MKKNRSQSYYRHHRNRLIAKKAYIFTVIWGNELDVKFPVGKWSKGKVHCSCKLCKFEKHFQIEKDKYKAKKQAMKQEMDEYFSDGCD